MPKKAKLFFVITLILGWLTPHTLSCANSKPQTSPYAGAVQQFEKFVKTQMSIDRPPGLSVGFIKDGFIWTKGFGYADLENMVSAKPESSYRLASVTKTITAIAVLQLAEAGKIDLEAEVQKYVPYFPRKKWPVTVRLLLGHLGGISHYKNYDLEGHIKVHKNTKEALAIFKDFDLVAQPGTRYHYSSYGFNLLGAIIEAASGKSYGQYIKEHIFEPLGMNNSRMDDPTDLIPNRVRGYRLVKGQIKNSEYVDVSSRFAAGGTRSTVVDLLKYAHGIMEGKLLKQKTWRNMFSSMVTKVGLYTGYGMGWGVQPWKGHFRVSHGGSQPETRTYILILPLEKMAISIASNLERVNLMPYVLRLAELVLDEDLDTTAYVPDRIGQTIYEACFQVFSYGLSQFRWLGQPTAKESRNLAQAFSYFNKYVNPKALKDSYKQTKLKIDTGIHPFSGEVFIKVGTYMAAALEESQGQQALEKYYKTGPLAFFNDYIHLPRQANPTQAKLMINNSLSSLLAHWQQDWKSVYKDNTKHLFINIDTDFSQLSPQLKKDFLGSSIYPDFSSQLAGVGQYFLKKNDLEKSFQILNLNLELYPTSPSALTSLAAAYLWSGNTQSARVLFRKAFALNPNHPSISLNSFYNLERELEQAQKIKEMFSLVQIAAEFYPRNAKLQKDIGDLYHEVGLKEKAIEHYKKALSFNPNYKEAKERLKKLKKEKQP